MFVAPAIAPIPGTSFARIAAELGLTKSAAADERSEAGPVPSLPTQRDGSVRTVGVAAR